MRGRREVAAAEVGTAREHDRSEADRGEACAVELDAGSELCRPAAGVVEGGVAEEPRRGEVDRAVNTAAEMSTRRWKVAAVNDAGPVKRAPSSRTAPCDVDVVKQHRSGEGGGR